MTKTMREIGHGNVVKYSYLWAREYSHGETTGRKTRPTCVLIVVAGASGKSTLLFPITSQQPHPGRDAIEVPDIEARRAKLYQPAWIIIDEFNRDVLTDSFALEDTRPIGRFSKTFMLRLAVAIRAVAVARRITIVPRK
jgi:hypothetical protein